MEFDELCDQCEEWMQPYLDRELDVRSAPRRCPPH